ncbi:nucleotide exchange factor GrpE [Stieleria varia]|uniref:Protein GrpE n=1 Tax=Stieleria varia TaxID=2528005 RepID=A0A5C6B2P2_9BACT|nr:nucleotide exchange factor GrpE [Stieleria varia]TWU05732.1 heat shock protein GrpE [Stieleria varia]
MTPESDDQFDDQFEGRVYDPDEAIDEVLQDEDAVQIPEQPETRDEEMERLRGEVDAAEKRALMAQAEAENFRKRMRRDFEGQLKFATTNIVTDLLEVRDNLVRAIEAAAAGEQNSGLREGVEMVAKQFDDALAKHGVRQIPAEGELFDPNFHEAISQMPSADHPSGTVAHVAVTGFQLHDRVVRPSQVVVSTGPPQ